MALFWADLFRGSPLTWATKNNMQPPQILLFTNFRISTLSGLGGVRETSDWSEKKKTVKNKKKKF